MILSMVSMGGGKNPHPPAQLELKNTQRDIGLIAKFIQSVDVNLHFWHLGYGPFSRN